MELHEYFITQRGLGNGKTANYHRAAAVLLFYPRARTCATACRPQTKGQPTLGRPKRTMISKQGKNDAGGEVAGGCEIHTFWKPFLRRIQLWRTGTWLWKQVATGCACPFSLEQKLLIPSSPAWLGHVPGLAADNSGTLSVHVL